MDKLLGPALLFLAACVAASWLAASVLRQCDEEISECSFDELKAKERE